MEILDSIQKLEEKDIGNCYKCENFIPIDEEGKCEIYEYPNHGVSVCKDWKLSEFWATKKGY